MSGGFEFGNFLRRYPPRKNEVRFGKAFALFQVNISWTSLTTFRSALAMPLPRIFFQILLHFSKIKFHDIPSRLIRLIPRAFSAGGAPILRCRALRAKSPGGNFPSGFSFCAAQFNLRSAQIDKKFFCAKRNRRGKRRKASISRIGSSPAFRRARAFRTPPALFANGGVGKFGRAIFPLIRRPSICECRSRSLCPKRSPALQRKARRNRARTRLCPHF